MISNSTEVSLASIFDTLETGIILYEPVFSSGSDHEPSDFIISYCNNRAAEMTGVSLNTMKNQRVLSLVNVDKEGRQILFDQIKTVYKTGQRSVTSFYNTFFDHYFTQTRTKLVNAVLTEVKDTTTEALEHHERERQTAFTDQILDQSINGWLTCEAVLNDEGDVMDFTILRINTAFTKLIRLPEEEAVGKPFLSVFPTARHNGTFQMNCRVFQSGLTERKMIHYAGDGLEGWYDVAVSKLENHAILVNFGDMSILGRAPYGMIQYRAVKDDKGNVIDFVHRSFNQVALDLSGFSFEELSTKTSRELSLLRNNLALFHTSLQVMHTGTPARFEYFVQAQNKWVDFSIVPYDDGVLMNFIDITPRIIQEKKVQEAADHFSSIIDTSLNAIYAWKAIRDNAGAVIDFEYTLVNKMFEKMTGKSGKEVIGKTALQLYPALKGTELFHKYIQVIETGVPAKFEDCYRDDKVDMWFEASAVKLGEDELFIGYRDITEQKEAALLLQEQNTLLDSILSNSPSGIVVVRMIRDETGTIVDGQAIMMNDAAERYTQYPKQVMLTQTSREMEPHILQSPVYQGVIKMMETGEPFHVEYQMEMTGQWVDMNVAKIDDDLLVNVFTDITERKKNHLEQERILYELKRSNDSLEEFARAASHDLKEPIRKVQYFVSRLKLELGEVIPQPQIDLFDRVEKAAERMRVLVEDLLEYSHLNVTPREKESINLNEKLQNVIDDLELLIREKKAVIDVGELPTTNGYRRQLQQLFQNLITNALKYSKPGVEPQIRINSRMVKGRDSGFHLPVSAEDEEFHLIELKDNGIGFEAEHAERIFDVFTRLHGNSEYPGTGIGLSIVKKVAENHGGYVMAKGERNAGASFFILLPV
jgi:PAS domain S-box-containing protein